MIEVGNRFKVAGSFRPNLGILVYSHYEGVRTCQAVPADAPSTTNVSGSGSDMFYFWSLDIEFNLRFEYHLDDDFGIFIEGQYSQGLSRIFEDMSMKFNFKNYSAGAGIAISF